MIMHHPLYLAEARLCNQYGAHLIADEIAVGFIAAGTLFACEQAGVRPTFVFVQGITGGYLPLSCVLTTDEGVRWAFYHPDIRRGFVWHCFTRQCAGLPRAHRRCWTSFAEDDVLAQNRAKAAAFAPLLAPLQRARRCVTSRQQGMIWAFDVATTRSDFALWRFSAPLLEWVCLLRPIGQTVYFMPPYVIEAENRWRNW